MKKINNPQVATSGRRPGTLATLRDVVPIRPLTSTEALRIAELQATKVLRLADLDQPPVPDSVITEIPRIEVRRLHPWPFAGATQWSKGTWSVVIRAADPATRQRFTLAHEFKHILDHPFVSVLYPAASTSSQRQLREQVCNYFAGCLLMPKVWVRRAWTEGCQDPVRLARRFEVSGEAMQVRLEQLGLTERPPRCNEALVVNGLAEIKADNEVNYEPMAV